MAEKKHDERPWNETLCRKGSRATFSDESDAKVANLASSSSSLNIRSVYASCFENVISRSGREARSVETPRPTPLYEEITQGLAYLAASINPRCPSSRR